VVSHWGISGGRFPEFAGAAAQHVDFIQTYSVFGPQSAVGQKVLAALKAKYPDIKGPGDVTPPVGVAYEGLIKTYHQPFSPENHDALNENDYIMVHYVGDQIEPLAK
jgi:branched-chain amino acid transport system substrate-binding protein